ncbi:MAG: amylo-alpha-1,6-glucosidase, partial [Actinomycetota bacterium]
MAASCDLITTKEGALFSCSRPDGDMSGLGVEGVWLNDARHLSRLILTLSGSRPKLEFSSDAAGTEATVRLRHSEHVGVTRHRSIGRSFVERITISNDGPSREQTVQVELDCDLTDMFVVRGLVEGAIDPPEPKVSEGHIRYERAGRDGLRRTTDVTASPPPTRVAGKGSSRVLEWDLALKEGSRRVIVIDVRCAPQDEPLVSPRFHVEPPRDPRLARALAAASRDLAVLQTPVEGHSVPAAGIPYYVALFGRDSLLTALALLEAAPAIARATLFALAEHQATADELERDAEPGKILHELRRGEIARSGELPVWPYYGSVDATPLFVLLAAEYTLFTGDTHPFDALEAQIVAALRWIDEFGDLDGDGFIEYRRRSARGLVNQGWKDSPDAIVDADGTGARGPIALCEVQGYLYAAKTKLAELLETRGRSDEAVRLRSEAADLRRSFRGAFWVEARGCYALALDGDKKQVASVTSNA